MDFVHDQVVLYSFVTLLLTTALTTQKHLPQMEGWKPNFLARVKNYYILFKVHYF